MSEVELENEDHVADWRSVRRRLVFPVGLCRIPFGGNEHLERQTNSSVREFVVREPIDIDEEKSVVLSLDR